MRRIPRYVQLFLFIFLAVVAGRVVQVILFPETGSPAPDIIPAAAPTVAPTATEAPPSPTAIPTATPIPDMSLPAVLSRALRDGNRDVPRLASVEVTGDTVHVQWAINDNLGARLIRIGARQDVVDILTGVREAGVAYEAVNLVGTFPMRDALGHVTEDPVIRVTFARPVVESINWADTNFVRASLRNTIFEVATSANVHPEFSETD